MSNCNPCVDHLGNTYQSLAEMLRKYNITDVAYHYRLNELGWSLEDALTKPKKSNKSTAIACTDHLGNTFASKCEMCDHWHIPRTIYFRRIRDGWSLEKALTTPVKTNKITTGVKDHLGNTFTTIDDMCQFWNISKKQYMINIRNNCSIEKALTTVTTWTVCKDHLGNIYKSINEMARTYGTNKTTIRSRIELGWTLKEILTKPQKIVKTYKCKDHKGNEFANKKTMLDHYGINETTFDYRRNTLGLSLKDALEQNNCHIISCTDHKGNHFDTIQNLCAYWNINTSSYHHRYNRLHWSIEKTLTTISPGKRRNFAPNITITNIIDNKYYTVILNNETYIWSQDQLWDYYRKTKYESQIKMNRNMKIFQCTINNSQAYIIAKSNSSAIKLFKKTTKYSETSHWDGEIPEYTTDILHKYSKCTAGIYYIDTKGE